MALKLGDFKTDVHNDWCPGCGDFGIVNAVQMALAEMQIPRHKSSIFSGIGCSGKTSHFINVFGVHTLLGRVLTFAQGAKNANPEDIRHYLWLGKSYIAIDKDEDAKSILSEVLSGLIADMYIFA